jgi:hypothetical protein
MGNCATCVRKSATCSIHSPWGSINFDAGADGIADLGPLAPKIQFQQLQIPDRPVELHELAASRCVSRGSTPPDSPRGSSPRSPLPSIVDSEHPLLDALEAQPDPAFGVDFLKPLEGPLGYNLALVVVAVSVVLIVVCSLTLLVLTAGVADSPELRRALNLRADARESFVRIWRFQQCLTATAGSGVGGPASLVGDPSCHGAHWPDLFGRMHHEGLILDLAAPNGVHTASLRLDYGRQGLSFKFSEVDGATRQLHLITSDVDDIPQGQGDPRKLVRLLETTGNWRYNLWTFNCNTFVQLVWDLYALRAQ